MFSPFLTGGRFPPFLPRESRSRTPLLHQAPAAPDQPDILAPCASLSPGPGIGLLRVTDQIFSGLVFQTVFLMATVLWK